MNIGGVRGGHISLFCLLSGPWLHYLPCSGGWYGPGASGGSWWPVFVAAGFWCFWGIVGILPCFGVVKYGVLLGAFVGFQLVAIWNPNIWQLLHLVAGLFGVHVLVWWWLVAGGLLAGWYLVAAGFW